jgi:hypothetical protein
VFARREHFIGEVMKEVVAQQNVLLTALKGGRPALEGLRASPNIAISEDEINILTGRGTRTKVYNKAFGNVMHRLAEEGFAKNPYLNYYLESQQIDAAGGEQVKKEADWTFRPGVERLFPSVELSSRYSVEAHMKKASTEKSLIVPFDKQ